MKDEGGRGEDGWPDVAASRRFEHMVGAVAVFPRRRRQNPASNIGCVCYRALMSRGAPLQTKH